MIHIRTLAARLFTLTAIWAIFAIALVAWFISNNYRDSVETNLAQRLTANLYNIMGSISLDENGRLIGRPDLRDSRFQAFQSGYYWSVVEVNDPTNQISSASLIGEKIEFPASVGFDETFQRQTNIPDKSDNQLLAIEAQVFLGEGDRLFSFKITGNRSEIDDQVNQFISQLLLVLGLFAMGFVMVTYFIVRIGLSPLRSATERLGDIREGRAEKLEGSFPLEIQPLIDEANALISSNKIVVERARTQVGNLAHSLKTPLAVLKNESVKTKPELRTIIEQQISQMQGQIQSYLDRARISARAGTVTSRTEIKPVFDRMIRVMQKLNAHLDFSQHFQDNSGYVFSGEQQDLEEMLGNLLENAAKFAKRSVRLTGRMNSKHLVIEVEDDGPGMTTEQAKMAIRRGTRIDETKPGSGLGLSIVKDITSEYGGDIELASSMLGGLKASLILPGNIKRA